MVYLFPILDNANTLIHNFIYSLTLFNTTTISEGYFPLTHELELIFPVNNSNRAMFTDKLEIANRGHRDDSQ